MSGEEAAAGSGSGGSEVKVRYAKKINTVSKRLLPEFKPAAAASPSPTSPTKSEKKVKEVSERLVKPKVKRELPPINRGPALKPEVQESLCQRLYGQSVQKILHKQERQEALLKKQACPSKTLSSEEQEEMIQRMYYQQRKADEANAKKLADKYIGKLAEVPKIEVAEFAKRLYYDRRESKKEGYNKLYEKYITQRETPVTKLSAAELEASTHRLHTKGH